MLPRALPRYISQVKPYPKYSCLWFHCCSVKSTTSDSLQSPLRIKDHSLELPQQSAQCRRLNIAARPQQRSHADPSHSANLKLALYQMGRVDLSLARRAVCRGFLIACLLSWPMVDFQSWTAASGSPPSAAAGLPVSRRECSVHMSHAYSAHGVNGLWTRVIGVVCPNWGETAIISMHNVLG